MALLRRHRDEHAAAIRYQMRQKLIAIGDDYWIEDEEGHRAFRVDGKAMRVRDTFILEDPGGDEVAKIQERKLSVRDKMVIERDGRRTRRSRRRSSGSATASRSTSTAARTCGRKGNFVDHEYEIERDGDTVATVSKRWFRVRDTYGVEVVPGEDDALVLAITVCIDAMAQPRTSGPGQPRIAAPTIGKSCTQIGGAAAEPGGMERAMTKSIEDPRARSPRGGPPVHDGRTRRWRRAGASPQRDHLRRAALPGAPDAAAARRARGALRDRVREAVQGDAGAGNGKYVEVARRGVDALGRQAAGDPALGPGEHVPEPVRAPEPARRARAGVGVVHRLPAVVHHAPGQSFLAGLADPALWQAFTRSASTRVHTGPVKQAGGLDGWRQTPSVDGHFDRISMQVDPAFGTEEQFRTLCATAAEYNGTVIDDIVPGHTGKGADFRLAEMGYARLPGHLPHGRDRPGGLAPAARRAARATTPSTSTPRPRRRSSAPATSSAGCSA